METPTTSGTSSIARFSRWWHLASSAISSSSFSPAIQSRLENCTMTTPATTDQKAKYIPLHASSLATSYPSPPKPSTGWAPTHSTKLPFKRYWMPKSVRPPIPSSSTSIPSSRPCHCGPPPQAKPIPTEAEGWNEPSSQHSPPNSGQVPSP